MREKGWRRISYYQNAKKEEEDGRVDKRETEDSKENMEDAGKCKLNNGMTVKAKRKWTRVSMIVMRLGEEGKIGNLKKKNAED